MKKIWRYIFIFVLIAGPIILLILPVDYFDSGESVCLSKSLFSMECYGCGMTRACMHLIHFDFNAAADFNKLSFVVVPLLAIMWLKFLLKQFNIHILKWL